MTHDRKELEDAFTRAEEELEIALRNHKWAVEHKLADLMRVSLENARKAQRELARLAEKLSKRAGQ